MGGKEKGKHNVTVSVIIPVYNGEANLRECLDSVSNQTLNDYEIICVDDCSTDNSIAILEEYRQIHNNIKIIRQPENMGAGPARNRGIKLARGEYIAFMDADDYYQHKDSLRNLYWHAVRNNADICGGGMRYSDTSKKKSADQYCFQDEGWIEFRDYQQYFYYQRFLFRRSMLISHNIFFPDYLRFQDPPFFVRAMIAAQRFYAVKEVFFVYREDGNHVTWNERKVNDMLQGHMDVLKLCMENGLGRMLYELLKRDLENKYLHNILEASLSEGNVKVAEFYHYLLACSDHVLISDMPALNLDYARAIDAWNRKTNMTFHHRSIALVDEPCDPAPCVSVIIPVYNTDQYVASCIDSILGQTLKDIEIICIDDGSTDNSSLILDDYERKHQRIRVYHQENQGLSAARNAGMQHARGKYIYFMDSDDFLKENALETLYQRAEADNLDVLFFGAQSFFDDNMTEEQRKMNKLPMEYKRAGEYPAVVSGKKMFCMQNNNKSYFTPVWIQFAKSEFLRKEDIAFYETLLHEDNLYTIQLLFKAERTGCIDEPFFQRRIRGNSIMTAKYTHRNALGLYLTITELMREFNDLSQQTEDCRKLIQKMQSMILNNLTWQWYRLSEVEKALFRASLTKEDRMMFNVLVMPTNEMRKQMIDLKKTSVPKTGTAAKAGTAAKPGVSAATVAALREEVKALRGSWAYRIGTKITWLPHKIKIRLGK